jgi:anti-sigma-K factor RskA
LADHPVPHPDLAGYVLRVLEPDELRAFEIHVRDCRVCADEVAELSRLPALLAQAAPHADVPSDLEVRTFARIEQDATSTGAVRELRSRERRSPRAQRLQRVLALAAGFLLIAGAVGLIVNVVGGAGQGDTTTIQLISATGGAAKGEARVRNTDEGRAVELEIEGLPPAPAGFYYECWFVGPGDEIDTPNRVSVGTFDVSDSGRTTVRMTSAGDAARFPNMGVTLEPDDGNPARTGRKVLVSM